MEMSYRYTVHYQYHLLQLLIGAGILVPCWLGLRSLLLLVTNPPVRVALALTGLLAALLLGGITAHLAARKICDKRGTAKFFDDHLELECGGRRFAHLYAEIRITENTFDTGKTNEGPSITGPLSVRYEICSGKSTLVLSTSIKEGWELFGGFRSIWRKGPEKPGEYSLDTVITELRKRLPPTGL